MTQHDPLAKDEWWVPFPIIVALCVIFAAIVMALF
jgi:hypothetical protein